VGKYVIVSLGDSGTKYAFIRATNGLRAGELLAVRHRFIFHSHSTNNQQPQFTPPFSPSFIFIALLSRDSLRKSGSFAFFCSYLETKTTNRRGNARGKVLWG
jgi:hypothetical protein